MGQGVVDDLPLISEKTLRRVVYSWNKTDHSYPDQETVHGLFEQQVLATPEGPALLLGDQSITFDQLNRRANQLAHYLCNQSIESGEPIGIALPRSPEMILALLATLKAGGVYVPLDPTYPAERLAFIEGRR